MKNFRAKIIIFIIWIGLTAVMLKHFNTVSLRLLCMDVKAGFSHTQEEVYEILIWAVAVFMVLWICRIISKHGPIKLTWKIRLMKRQFEFSSHQLPYQYIVLLSCVSFLMLFAAMYLRDVLAERNEEQPFEEVFIAHAFGGINDEIYTNSKEALLYNYGLGYRAFEADFNITSDEKLVCLHDWSLIDREGATEGTTILSKEEFESGKIYNKYTPISVEDVLLFMSEHEDVWIVTDTKEVDSDRVQMEFSYIVDTAYELEVEEVLDRVVVQIYNPEMYQIICEIYEFPYFIFTLYQYWDGRDLETFCDICRFCAYNDIQIITTWYYWVTPEMIQITDQYNIKMYVHTVNDMETVTELKKKGVKGFYTDYLISDGLE